MKIFQAKIYLTTQLATVVTLLIAVAGCQNQVTENHPSGGTSDNSITKVEQPQVLSAVNSDNVASPAQQPNILLEDVAPNIVCEKFLAALRNNDAIVAGQQLTKKALFETRRADLELGAPGGENATYQLGKTYYATEKKEVAQVECFVTEGSETSTLMWILKTEKVGWKISGMYMQSADQSGGFIDFENRAVVEGIKMAVQEFDVSEETRQAHLPTGDENLK